jgi:hypothetical protein
LAPSSATGPAPRCWWMGGGTRLPGPRAVLGSAVQAQAGGRSRIGVVAADCSTSASTAPAHCRVRSRVGARARPPPAGLAAQPLPHRPGRGRTRLRVGRTAGQRQRRRPRIGHDLAVAAQGLHPPRPGHARPQPRSRPPARHRHGQPPRRPAGHPDPGPGICGAQPGCPPRPPTIAGRALPMVRREEQYATLGANVVVELHGESHARRQPPAPGRSSDEPTAATGWPTNAPAAPIAATPTEPTAPAAPTNPRSGRWRPIPAEPTGPYQRAASDSTLVVYLDVLGHDPRRRQVMSR